jgi:hypothetical protein
VGADGLVHHGETVDDEGALAEHCGQQHPVAGLQAAAAAQRGGNRDVRAARRVTMPSSALMTARSATRPEASMRPIP